MRRVGALYWSAFLVVILGSNCQMCGPKPDRPDAGPGGGSGTIKMGGSEKPYSIVTDETKMLILVKKLPEGGTICGRMHDHAVRSTSTQFTFALDKDAPASSTLEAKVFAFGLTADRGEDRDEFDRTRGNRETAGSESQIEESTRGHLKADEFPEMTFTAHALTSLDGAGTAPVDVHLKGQDSTFSMTATATWTGDRLVIDGTGTIDGTHHAIPQDGENFKECVDSQLDLKMHLVFAPGASDGGVDVPDAAGHVAREFPDDGTCGTTGFADVHPILVRRCAGCHTDPSVGVSTIPLAHFSSFRMSTNLEPEKPLYMQALERIQLPLSDPNAMPPPADGARVPADEIAIVQAWVDSGAHEAKCNADGGVTGPAPLDLPVPACGTITFEQVKTVLGNRTCFACHSVDTANQPDFNTSLRGMQPASHNYYRPYNVWETSALRMKDGTMPPFATQIPQADYELVWRYAQQEKTCQ